MITLKEILELLARQFKTLTYLETESATTGRYKEKQIIIFEYENIAGSKCVLKFFSLQHIDKDAQEQEKAMLLQEFRMIKMFGMSPHVVRVYDANELRHEGKLIGFYITMEKFDHILADLIQKKKKFSENEVKRFLIQMDLVLYQAHYQLSEPIVHSDIKPANIGIRKNKEGVYEFALMDFDVSVSLEKNESENNLFTLSNKASIRGLTLAYAPPEQAMAYLHRSGNISNRVDVYAIGAIAMQMLTGVAPRKDESQVYYQLPFEKVPQQWKEIFTKLCSPDPKTRVRRIEDAFSEAGSPTQVHVESRPSTAYKVKKPGKFSASTRAQFLNRHQKKVVAGAAALLSVVLLSITFLLMDGKNGTFSSFMSSLVPVQINTNPGGADVRINGRFIGTTDESGILLTEAASGSAVIILEREGYEVMDSTIQIGGSTINLFQFELESNAGSLLVESSATSAGFILRDGTGREYSRWSGDEVLRNLPAGNYTLTAIATGYTPYVTEIEIAVDDLTTVQLDLRPFTCGERISDADGNSYPTTEIAGRCWTAENLRTSRYTNGDPIVQIEDSREWQEATMGSWAYFDNNRSYVSVYGKLYNWNAVEDPRGLCPDGWTEPSDIHWDQMVRSLGTDAGGGLKSTGLQYWQAPNTGATNETGFTALPAANRSNDGSFSSLGGFAFFWSSSEFSDDEAVAWYITHFNTAVTKRVVNKNFGFSVRCVEL